MRPGRASWSSCTHGRPRATDTTADTEEFSSVARCRRCTGTTRRMIAREREREREREAIGKDRRHRNRLRGIASEWNRWRHVGSPITIILATRYIVLPAWYSTSLVIRSLWRRALSIELQWFRGILLAIVTATTTLLAKCISILDSLAIPAKDPSNSENSQNGTAKRNWAPRSALVRLRLLITDDYVRRPTSRLLFDFFKFQNWITYTRIPPSILDRLRLLEQTPAYFFFLFFLFFFFFADLRHSSAKRAKLVLPFFFFESRQHRRLIIITRSLAIIPLTRVNTDTACHRDCRRGEERLSTCAWNTGVIIIIVVIIGRVASARNSNGRTV